MKLPGNTAKTLRVLIVIFFLILGLYSLFIAFAHHFIGNQESFLLIPNFISPDAPFSLKVIVRDHKDNTPIENAAVYAQVVSSRGGKKILLSENWKTDSCGTVNTTLAIPSNLDEGELELRVIIRSEKGLDRLSRKLPLRHPTRLLLATDKNTYKPGETIYLRVSVLDQSNTKPLGAYPVKLRVEDPKGNLILDENGSTSPFGIFATKIPLADIINAGTYIVKARIKNDYLEKKITIAEPDLCSYNLDVITRKRFFTPGDKAEAHAHVESLSGAPVRNAPVSVLVTMKSDKESVLLDKMSGITDASGNLPFTFHLPSAQKSLSSQEIRLIMEVDTRDENGQQRHISKSFPVNEKPFIISFLPEGGGLIPGIKNRLFLISFYPDGNPVQVSYKAKIKEEVTVFDSDSRGIAELLIDPEQAGTQIGIFAKSRSGETQERLLELPSLISPNTFMIKSDKVLYQSRDKIAVDIFSLENSGFLCLDLIACGQVYLSKTIKLQARNEKILIEIPENLLGFAELRATGIDNNENFRVTSRPLFIAPFDSLKVGMTLDRKSYAPGDEAKVKFSCGTPSGKESALEVSLYEETPASLNREINEDLFPPSFNFTDRLPRGLLTSVRTALSWYKPDTGDDSLQTMASIAFLPMKVDENSQYYLNFYSKKLEWMEERRNHYFSQLFLISFRMLLIGSFISFLVILAMTLTHAYLKGRDEKRILLIRDNEELISLLIFLIGFFVILITPMLFALPIFLFSDVALKIQNKSFVQLFLTFEIFIMFIYLIALWRNIRLRPVRKMATLKISFIGLQCYVGSLILLIFMLFLASLTRWNMRIILAHNTPYLLVTLLTLCAMPFLLLYNTLSHLTKPRKSPFRIAAFYFSSAIIIVALILSTFLIFGHSAHIRKEMLSRFAPAASSTEPVKEESQDYRSKISFPDSVTSDEISDMPETFFYEPQLITTGEGNATLSLVLPDAPGGLKMTARGLTRDGERGGSSKSIPLRKGFHLDAGSLSDLTVGDEVTLPVYLESYASKTQNVEMRFSGSPGIKFMSDRELKLTLSQNEKRVVFVTFKTMMAGQQAIIISGKTSNSAITITRDIQISPPGITVLTTKSGWTKKEAEVSVDFPEKAIPLTSQLEVKIYPGLVSLIADASATLTKPAPGNFEEAVSAAYPSILLRKRLKESSARLTTLERDLERSVLTGYQRILHFESPPGGFSMFGESPGSVWLTAYGLSCLTDLRDVSTVDERLLKRASDWLNNQQKSDGSWEGSPRTTAFVLRSLLKIGAANEHRVKIAMEYLKKNIRKDTDPYSLGLCAQVFCLKDPGSKYTARLLERLPQDAIKAGGRVYWSPGQGTLFSPPGTAADIETTALCTRILMDSQMSKDITDKALDFLIESKDPEGGWHSPMATVETIKTLLGSAGAFKTGEEISVSVNGKMARVFSIKSPDDLVETLLLKDYRSPGRNEISLKGNEGMVYQIVERYAESRLKKVPENELKLSVEYDRIWVSCGDDLTETILLENQGNRDTTLIVVQQKTPAGFEIRDADLERLKNEGKIEDYRRTQKELCFYLKELKKEESISFSFRLKALYPVRISVPSPFVFESNNPGKKADVPPVTITVR